MKDQSDLNQTVPGGQGQQGNNTPKKKKRKIRPLILVLDLLIIGMIVSGVWLLAEPYYVAWKQDQVMDQIFAKMDEIGTAPDGTSAEPTPTPTGQGVDVLTPGEDDFFEGIWVDPNVNHIPGEGWEDFGGEETTPTEEGYYVPNSVQLIPMGRIKIESIGLDLPLLKGAELVPLRYGAGWYESSSRPGSQGRATILGHTMMTNSKRFFSRLPETSPGQKITIEEKNRTLHYEIYEVKYVSVNDLPNYLVNFSIPSEIMLVTCYNRPYWDQRCLVFARLTGVT